MRPYPWHRWSVILLVMILGTGGVAQAGSPPAASWTAESNQPGARMGAAIAAAGDVNGDGYADIAVGMPDYGGSLAGQGRVAVYLGSASGPAATPALTLDGGQAGAHFGSAVTFADVNGDGYGDLVVGAPDYNGMGRVLVYMGSSSGLSSTAARQLNGSQAGGQLGAALGAAGDVNGDGYGDVIVGAPLYDSAGGTDAGRALVYLGSASGLAATAGWTVDGSQAGAKLGFAVAGAGDVNGDGYGDVIVGAPLYDHGQTDEGQAQVFLGSALGLATTAAWTVESDQDGAQLGYAVAGAGDTDASGYSGVIVGAPYYDATGKPNAGLVRVYKGSAAGISGSEMTEITGSVAGIWLGTTVAQAGDLNGDGLADILAGAPGYTNGQAGEGMVLAYLMEAGDSWSFESNQAGAALGSAVSAGDVNGDGLPDVITGAPDYDNGQTDEGRITLYLGAPGLPSAEPVLSVESGQAGAQLGSAVAWVGDVNGDGYADMVVGAPAWSNGQSDEGRVSLHLGSASGVQEAAAWNFESDQAGAQLGAAVAGAGDVNGDGYADVIVGAPYAQNGQSEEGRVYLFLGSPTGLAATPAWTYESNQAFAHLGASVAGAGDVNGDGYADVIVGAPFYNNGTPNEGAAMVFIGSGAGLASSPVWTVSSGQNNARLGSCVAGVGDVNGDGYSDVLAGAPLYNATLTDEGRAFVYLGSASGLATTPAWTADGKQATAQFGAAAAAAGDVNGDGYGDVVVGAPFYDNGQSDEGRVYAYLGSASGLAANPAWTAEGNQDNAQFGAAVASAGDVNGDGYGDVLIGAPSYGTGGRASLYLGSTIVLPAMANWTFDGDQAGAGLGSALAGMGDGNGDGISDLLIGKPGHDSVLTDEGEFLVFHGDSAGDDSLGLRPRQVRLNSADPIAPLGLADDPLAFRVGALGRSPLGRGKVRLQVEVKPLGQLFDGTGLQTVTGWTDSGVAGTNLLTSVSIPLNNAATVFHWRARLRYAQVSNPLQDHGRWFSVADSGWQQADLRLPLRGPSIQSQPQSRTVFPGTTVSFSVSAAGPGTFTYQWRKGGVDLSNGGRISGAKSATLSITSVDPADAGSYTCVVENGAASVETNPATLDVVTRLMVDAASPGPARNGFTWATAYPSVQAAVTQAASSGVHEIWVARGTYSGVLMLSSNIAVYGGFEGWSGARESSLAARDWQVHETILSGADTAYHVVVMDGISSATLDGFTVTDGNAVNAGGTNHSGGGIFCNNLDSSNLIANCTIRANRAMTRGGGIFCLNASPRFSSCAIYANSAGEGGGVACVTNGTPVFTGCVIAGNTASGNAGGLLCDGASPTLNACKLVGNQAQGGNGGALSCTHNASPLLVNGLLGGNTAAGDGGALDSSWDAQPTLLNCTVNANHAEGAGGGLALRSPAILTNTILAGNNQCGLAELDVAAFTTVTACLFDANPDGDLLDRNGAILNGADAINLSLPGASANVSGPAEFVMHGGTAVSGSLTDSPVYDSLTHLTTLTDTGASYTPGALAGQFVNPNSGQPLWGLIVDNTATTLLVAGDLSGVCAQGDSTLLVDVQLRNGSAALDRGRLAGAPATDLAGTARPGADGKVDIGAYEGSEAFVPAADAQKPVSRVSTLPTVSTQATFAVPFRASDAASGVDTVRLYYRANGGAWTLYGSPAAASPFTFTAPDGDGLYEFFSLATDARGNVEAAKSAAEASIAVITSFSGSRVYVDLAATGQQTGQDWTHALHDVTGAVALAAGFGVQEVWVARGTYTGSVTMHSNVAVYGGFEGGTGASETQLSQRDWTRNVTILHGGGTVSHVVVFNGTHNATLDGFTVTGGNATNLDDTNHTGGGILCQDLDSSNLIRNCLIHDNRAVEKGGGIACLNASPQVTACRIYANSAGEGGGVACVTGGGPVFDGCVIAGNTASGNAGGLLCDGALPALDRCVLSGNQSQGGYGGALSCAASAGPVLQNCILSGNSAPSGGGAIDAALDARPVLLNCTVADNGSSGPGGGLVLSGQAVLVNTVLRNNAGYAIVELGDNAQTSVTACLFDANPDGDYLDKTWTTFNGAVAINGLAGARQNVEGAARFAMNGSGATTGTLSAPPSYDPSTHLTTFSNDAAAFTPGALAGRLVNPDLTQRRQALVVDNTATSLLVAGDLSGLASAGSIYALIDYHLNEGSAAIDRGTNQGTPSTDFDGQARPVDIYGLGGEVPAATHDIGAYEVTGPTLHVTSAQGSPVPPVGDHFLMQGMQVAASQGGIQYGAAGTRYLPLGFTGTGSVPASGSTTSTAFIMTGESSLAWRWQTQHQVTAAASPAEGGRVMLADGITDASGTWHNAGAAVSVKAVASTGWGFTGWSGDASGTATSASLTLSAPRAVTATFVALPVIQQHPADLTVNQGSPASFTVSATGPAPLSYRWYHGASPLSDVSGITGSAAATLQISSAQPAHSGAYHCEVTNPGGTVPSNAATLVVNSPAVVLSSPGDQTVNPGATVTFSVTASGTAPLACQWQKDGQNLTDGLWATGTTSTTLKLTLVSMSDAGRYRCRVSNMAGQDFSNAARLTVNPTLTVVSPHGTPTPAKGAHVYTTETLVNAALAGSPEVDTTGTTRFVATGWTGTGSVAASGTTTQTTFALDQDSSLTWRWKTQYRLAATASPATGGRVTLADGKTTATDSWHDAATTATVKAVPNSGWVFGSWSGAASGKATTASLGMIRPLSVTATFIQLPTITRQPVKLTVNPGAKATFSVTAGGTAPLSYEWRKNGVKLTNGGRIAGASGATLTISSAQQADEGSYSCRVSNAGGQVISTAVTLTVNDPPVITTQPLPRTVNPGTTATFTMRASGTAPLVYRWRKNGVDMNDGSRISGANTATLKIGNCGYSDATIYTCRVTNMAGMAVTTGARLVVNPTLTITSTYGTCSPHPGTYNYTTGTLVTARVAASAVAGPTGTRYAIRGWKGTGAVTANGVTSSVTFKIDRPTTINWQWVTQYKLTTLADKPTSGSVTLSDGKTASNGTWYDSGKSVSLRAVAKTGWKFAFWFGDTTGSASAWATIKMDKPKTVGARFAPARNAADDWEWYE